MSVSAPLHQQPVPTRFTVRSLSRRHHAYRRRAAARSDFQRAPNDASHGRRHLAAEGVRRASWPAQQCVRRLRTTAIGSIGYGDRGLGPRPVGQPGVVGPPDQHQDRRTLGRSRPSTASRSPSRPRASPPRPEPPGRRRPHPSAESPPARSPPRRTPAPAGRGPDGSPAPAPPPRGRCSLVAVDEHAQAVGVRGGVGHISNADHHGGPERRKPVKGGRAAPPGSVSIRARDDRYFGHPPTSPTTTKGVGPAVTGRSPVAVPSAPPLEIQG